MNVNVGLEIEVDEDMLLAFLDRMAREYPDVAFYGKLTAMDPANWQEFRATEHAPSRIQVELRQIVAEMVAWGFEALQEEGFIFMSMDDIGVEISDYHLVQSFV